MEGRPEKIYLEEPVIIGTTKVMHTREGLNYLIEHYTHMLETKHKGRTQEVEAHMRMLIKNWQLHLVLYEKI